MPSHFIIAGTRFPLVDRRLDLAGTSVDLAAVPYSPGELDQITALLGLKERTWPYWLEDWPATWSLAAALAAERPSDWPGPVLDLGCGSGVLGAWLRARFGVEAFSCDFNSDACRLAAVNIGRNGAMARGRVFCADMRAFPSRLRFGLVLAGEMLYTTANHEPVLAFLRNHLAPGGRALLADKGRSAADGFAAAARARGFAVGISAAAAPGAPEARIYTLKAADAPGG